MKKKFPYQWLLLSLPFFLCLIGYIRMQDGDITLSYILSSLFESFKIYGMSVSDTPPAQINIWLEIARWMGAIVTTTIVLRVLKTVLQEISLRWKLHNSEIIAVHGDGMIKKAVLQSLGKSALDAANEMCFRAKRHILAFDQDSTAIRYLTENEKALFDGKGKSIYLASSEYEASDYQQHGLIVSNTALNCARLYWQKHWLREDSIRRIAIIGFGAYGQRLLEQALLVNVLPCRSPIEYHVLGNDGQDYLAWHPQLKECVSIGDVHQKLDSVHFHPSLEQLGPDALKGMDRIILSLDTDDENILCLNRLLAKRSTGEIHIRCNASLFSHIPQPLPRQHDAAELKVVPFGGDNELYTEDVLLHGKLCESARNAHINYVANSMAEKIRAKYPSCAGCNYQRRCGDRKLNHRSLSGCKNIAATWDDLTPFEKAANIAATDHLSIKRYLYSQMKQGHLTREDLCRTEHIRWCRFCFLHNWQYAPERDDANRLHPALVPFEALNKQEQEKDWYPYQQFEKQA